MNGSSLPPPDIPGLTYLKKLGAGGYADVYLYQQAMPHRRVAVKVLRDVGVSSSLSERFRSEANAMALLEHPNIVPVYATGVTADRRPYLVMMYYPRASLAERVKAERLSVAETLRIGIQLCGAVETAHRAGLLHRDIKPANVLTSQYGAPGLTDFGIAADVAAAADDDTGVSVPWSPPETLFVTAAPTARSDVYSLAATLWQLLVGRSPFEIPGGDNGQFALMRRIRDVAPPSTGRADVPASLDRLLRAALSKSPAMRPGSAQEFARSLQTIEAELRLPRTEIVLAADERTTLDARQYRGDETRVKGAQLVVAQPEATVEEGDDLETRRRMPTVASQPESVDATIRRTLPEQTVPVQASEPSSRRGLMVGAGLLAILLVGAVSWSLANGNKTVVPTPTETMSTPPPDLTPVLPPGPLTVNVTKKGTTVRFSWTYANALAADEFWYTFDEQAPKQTTKKPFVETKVSSGGQTCLWVKVHRTSGNDATDYTKRCTP